MGRKAKKALKQRRAKAQQEHNPRPTWQDELDRLAVKTAGLGIGLSVGSETHVEWCACPGIAMGLHTGEQGVPEGTGEDVREMLRKAPPLAVLKVLHSSKPGFPTLDLCLTLDGARQLRKALREFEKKAAIQSRYLANPDAEFRRVAKPAYDYEVGPKPPSEQVH